MASMPWMMLIFLPSFLVLGLYFIGTSRMFIPLSKILAVISGSNSNSKALNRRGLITFERKAL